MKLDFRPRDIRFNKWTFMARAVDWRRENHEIIAFFDRKGLLFFPFKFWILEFGFSS